jgi:tryptophan 2-C-methyltransferase
MLTLVNTNRMSPTIAPLGLEYVGSAAQAAGLPVDILDLGLSNTPKQAIQPYLSLNTPRLVGLSFRNVDDCFWPSAQGFVSQLTQIVQEIRQASEAPIVLGGVGYSIFPGRLLAHTGVDFGIHGDGEQAIVSLYQQLRGARRFDTVPGLLWRKQEKLMSNAPAWPKSLSIPTTREFIDNRSYFQTGGQMGLETKRGCPRNCLYCADPLAKGQSTRVRAPVEVADEAEALLAQGIDVLHLCDAEFNIPHSHALAVCQEFVRRGLGNKLRWYAYLSVIPFDHELANAMRQAGCVGIDFTTDAACASMLEVYNQPYVREDIAQAVKLCHDNGITVMTDLLLGGPGETPETLAETIAFMKKIKPHGVGAGLGLRIYPGTPMDTRLHKQGPLEENPNIKRKYDGPIDLLKPTFYISQELGAQPALLIKDLIGEDGRFFAPTPEIPVGQSGHAGSEDHNYNDNRELTDAIAQGARGAYWHIMLRLRGLA